MLLAAVLLLQLTFHTIHVFIAHGFEAHSTDMGIHSQIDETNIACELCAQFLGQSFGIWSNTLVLVFTALLGILISTHKDVFLERRLKVLSMRGPPFSSR
ncbi:hypothetical protein MTsPCn5_07260 [Croceitalea sp. MTPC5]|nr:hypothetical protein MTsPCn5_07260 [Croceitalea sp. MTPC5]